MHYHHDDGKAYSASLGLGWDEAFAERADKVALKHGLTQPQWDVLVREHAWRVKCLFNPKMYPWKVRFLLAFHFLNPFYTGA